MKTEFEADLSEAFARPRCSRARWRRPPVSGPSTIGPGNAGSRAPVTVGAGCWRGAATAGAVLSVDARRRGPGLRRLERDADVADATAPSASAATNCQSQLTSMPRGAGWHQCRSETWQNVLTDVRGPFTVALFQNDGSYAACFTSSSFTEVDQVSSSGNSASSSSVQR